MCAIYVAEPAGMGQGSKWFKEGETLKRTAGKKALLVAIEDEKSFFDALTTWLPTAEELYFAGGEPLLMDQHYRLLALLIDTGNTQVHLRYNTNFSVLQHKGYDIIQLWKQFEKVTVGASFDAAGTAGELIRKESKWDQLVANVNALKSACPHVQFEIAPTVSILNVFEVCALHRFAIEAAWIEPGDLYLNLLERPNYYNIKVLGEKAKAEVAGIIEAHVQWLKTFTDETDEKVRKVCRDFRNLVTYMLQEDWSHLQPKLSQENQTLDALRAEKTLEVLPHLKHMD